VNVNPNPTFNGSFLFAGTETASGFTDFLIGVASNYNQADSQTFYARHKYAAAFAQDSWRILSLSYVGSQAHHLLLVYSANPGNPALCLALSKPDAVAPQSSTWGPFAEDATYITAAGKVINGTRGPFGSNFSNDGFGGSFGNSSYNPLEGSLGHTSSVLDMMPGCR
jgi:hypothetical protein